MRVERIRTPIDVLEFAVDQLAHSLVVVACVLGAWLLGAGSGVGLAVGAGVLAGREVHQYFAKDRYRERELRWYVRHLDRTLDVVLGVLGGALFAWVIPAHFPELLRWWRFG